MEISVLQNCGAMIDLEDKEGEVNGIRECGEEAHTLINFCLIHRLLYTKLLFTDTSVSSSFY